MFVMENYYPKLYANAVCTQTIINLYLKEGYTVDVVCDKRPRTKPVNNWNGVNIHYIKPNFRFKMFLLSADSKSAFGRIFYRFIGKTMSLLFRIFCFPWLPRMSFSFPRRYMKKVQELNARYEYDAIVTTVNPLEAGIALSKLKKQNKLQSKWIVYCIDTLLDHNNKDKTKKSYLYKMFLKHCDRYIYMKPNELEYVQPYLSEFKDKLTASDLPMVIDNNGPTNQEIASKYNFDHESEHWSYFGSIGGRHYHYKDLLDFFFSLPNDKNYVLHFFSRGAQIKYDFKSKESENKKVIIHGYVDSKTMSECMKASDVLISIKYSPVISAKFFQYMSYCKRIVHISGTPSDPDIKYLSRYPNSIILKTYENSINDLVKQYLNSSNCKTLSFNDVAKTFYMNTPEFTKAIIDKEIGK